MDSYGSAMRRYFEFAGRSTRSEFWLFTLISLLLGLLARVIDHTSGTAPVLYFTVSLIHLIPSLSVFVRRMHDTDRSGWLFLLFFTLVGAIPLLVFLCQRSSPGPNRYGSLDEDDVYVSTPLRLPGASGAHAATSAGDAIRELERLSQLRASGVISEAEFTSLKTRVMAPPNAGRVEPTF